MLEFFTDPYEDELLYSTIARYHYYSGNISMRETLIQTLGDGNALPSVAIPCRLEYLSGQLKNQTYTSDYFIGKHTILPYYLPFLNRECKERVLSTVKKRNGKGIFTLTGMAAGGICRKTGLYYCSQCAIEDIKQYGEAYFHRIHQLEGIFVCDRHGSNLKQYPVTKEKASRIQFIRFASEYVTLDEDENREYDLQDQRLKYKLHELSIAARYILDRDYLQSDSTKLYENITLWLSHKGYLTKKGRVRQKDFCHDLKKFYGEEFLNLLESNFELGRDYSWPCEIVRRPNKAIHPVRYIMVSLFLLENVEGLFYPPALYKDKCDGNDIRKTANFFDEQWKLRLSSEIKFGGSLRSIARKMGCDPKTVIKYAMMLGIEALLNSKIKVYTPKGKHLEADYSTDVDDIRLYIDENPGCTRNEVRKHLSRQYMRLYKHRQDLLYSILPDRVKPAFGGKKKVDWSKRDIEILSRARTAYSLLLSMAEPVRISFSRLMKEIGYSSLRFYLNKLPFTKMYIEQVIESVEDFQLRRVDYVCRKLYDEKGIFEKWEVMRVAGLKEKVSHRVMTRIEENIQYLT